MLKKSYLLEYLISYAETLLKKDGKKTLSANYFMMALLETLEDAEHNRIPSELDRAEVKQETETVQGLLNKYGIHKKEAFKAIAEAVTAPDYKSFMDEILFSKLTYSAEEKTKQSDLDFIDTSVYLELILADPTEIIKKCVLERRESSGQAKADTLTARNIQDLINKFSLSASSAPTSSTPPSPSTPSTPSSTSVSSFFARPDQTAPRENNASSDVRILSDIVQKTRDIQNKLLESVYGQDHAVNTFVSGYFQSRLMACARNEAKKPQATFLFAGPPGVGKTFLAEKAAEALALPYQRFDMSEYSDKEANIEFCGSDNVYKNGKPGNVTEFVANNPKCVLLFDEIEKAHINIIYLFLQILDAGRIRDNFTDKEVSFTEAVIIFTTNVGKNLYADSSVVNLSSLPRKKILKALSTDINPATGAPLFPAAICSRFASGNVIMFNHLEANNLYTITKRELDKNVKGLESTLGIKINIDEKVPSAIMFSEGGKADARTVSGRANAFFHEELYELFRLLPSDDASADAVGQLTQVNISVPLDRLSSDVSALFENPQTSEILVFADENVAMECKNKLGDHVVCHIANNLESAKDILFTRDVDIVLCDITCGTKDNGIDVLNAEDVSSDGHDFLTYVLEKYSLPVYLLQLRDGVISREELLSFAKLGARGILSIRTGSDAFTDLVLSKCRIAYQQANMMKLARENKALSYKTAQTVSEDRKTANIHLFDFRLSLITDVDDSHNVLDNVSRPDLHFDDVIGAEDAKRELKYFVEYLKNPVKYMRKGVRSPKGILLYGPPGTGKTMLAKAMAGESGVTFLRAEGNEFLKRYVGEGAESVHSLFMAARKYAPSVIFVDEIDAIGKSRESLGSEDHTGDVLTAFLTEMDGFNTDTSKPVFVLAATNYGVDSSKGKSLDAALLRRFDRRIYVDLPNKEERKRYLEMKLGKNSSIQLSQNQIDNIAMRSTGMSLAELESVFEMALRSAIRSENGIVGDAEFEEAFETFQNGEKKEWHPDSLIRTARHEAGHALICWLSGEKPSYLTIVARGDHGGYMQHANSEDKGVYTKSELLGKIRCSLGGRAAEMVYYGPEEGISTGAGGDLYSATNLAQQMICRYGMDEVFGLAYMDNMTQGVHERVNAILREELDRAIKLIEANKAAIDAIVEALMDKNHLKEKEMDDIFCKTVIV